MNIEIRRLTPDLAEDYAHFFDVTPHNVKAGGGKCYCVTWRCDNSYLDNGEHWFPSCEERRKRAIQFVKDGSLQGYLAYCGNEVVGWCNANENCQLCINYLRNYWPIEDYHDDIKIKSVFCFAIAPDMQRNGIATKLLERVCSDAANDGFDFVEAYADKTLDDTAEDCRGYLAMYEKCGFIEFAEREGRVVVRRALK